MQPISLPTSCVNQGSNCSIIVGQKILSEMYSPIKEMMMNPHDYIWVTDILTDYLFTDVGNKLKNN